MRRARTNSAKITVASERARESALGYTHEYIGKRIYVSANKTRVYDGLSALSERVIHTDQRIRALSGFRVDHAPLLLFALIRDSARETRGIEGERERDRERNDPANPAQRETGAFVHLRISSGVCVCVCACSALALYGN